MLENSKKWQKYIKGLTDFPSGEALWENDFIRILLTNIPRDKVKSILEIGCSNGRFLKWLRSIYQCPVYGIDEESIGFRKESGIYFKVGDARYLPYQDEIFDFVFSIGLIEHFKKNDRIQCFKEQYRVLKKGGYLLCQIPILNFSLNYFYTKIFYDFRNKNRHYWITPCELRNYFKNLNLEIIVIERIGCLLESKIFHKIKKIAFLKHLLATEILIISVKK